ncbi:MAG: tetratricopeptide repeat protein [Anaerolineales bacterium]
MSELSADFRTLPEEYQRIIHLAQETHGITVAPLQVLVGGWSGANVYLVSISHNATGRTEHGILKLDHKSKNAKTDEVTRHNSVMTKSTPEFAREHVAELVFDRVEQDSVIAIFYRIAGQSLLQYRPLAKYERQNQLQVLFTETNKILLNEWNKNSSFNQAVHPQSVLQKWLGFRLDAGGNIEHFLQDTCRVNPDVAGLLINGHIFPNPLAYARKAPVWGKARSIDIATGFIHGDLNANNVLVKFNEAGDALDGYYLIDFALFKEDMPLLYDQRYLEMSYLTHAISQISFAKCVSFLTRLAVADSPDPHKVAIELSGVSAVIGSARSAFAAWVDASHPSLRDDLWGQYWLAGVAAGLTYTHKAGMSDKQRLAGLIYAAANLRRYLTMFNLPLPTNVELLYDENESDSDSPGALKPKRAKHNLPVQRTPFIGRAAQVTAIKELLQQKDVHIVTLLGLGGTGKTRLSLQVAQELIGQFRDGVFFVPLADDTNSDQLISRIAQQLEVKEGGRPPLETIKDYLHDKNLLLVLDNFEQIVSAAPTVAKILDEAPQLKVLVSSRVALNLQGEYEVHVPPLDLPEAENKSAWETLLENESILLFVERAREAHPKFALTKDNASDVAAICRRLDGLPLALELAAARVKLLSPQAILSRLDDSLKLLTGGARDLPTRQQTLRNTLQWSYDLLDDDEKILLTRLSIFVGGFTLEAAEAVCNAEGTLDILDGLTSLVDNSLLRQEQLADDEPRFGMLEIIRAYAAERLTERGEMEILRGQHAKYFCDAIMNQMGFAQLYSSNATHWLNWLEREHDNIRATLAWGLTTPQGVHMGAGLVIILFWFWYRRGYFSEGRMWSERLLASPTLQSPSEYRVFALGASGMLSIWQGKQDIGLAQLQECLTIQQKLENGQALTPLMLMANGVALINMGKDDAAQPLFEQAQKLFKEQNNPYFHAITLIHLGNTELGLGNLQQARTYHEEALAQARTMNENWIIAFALNNLGEVARTQGQFDRARSYYEECEILLSTTGDRGDIPRFVHNLGYIAQHEENFELAESQFRKSLKMFRRLGNRRGIAESLAGLAGLKAQQGQTEWGATLLSAAETLLKSTGGAWWPADRVEVERNREMMRIALTPDDFARAQKIGEGMNSRSSHRLCIQ